MLPEVVTVRLIVLGVVVLLAAVLLIPTVRAAVNQSVELRQMRSTLAQREAEAEALARELERWEDPAYIEGQARERLQYAMPGDQVWRTIGGEGIVDDVDPLTGEPVDDGVVGTLTGDGTPWYAALWDSVRTADGPPADEGADAGENAEGAAGEGDGGGAGGAAGTGDGESADDADGGGGADDGGDDGESGGR